MFLLQYSRQLERKVEIEKTIKLVEETLKKTKVGERAEIGLGEMNDEYQWFIANGYLKDFLKDNNAKSYEYVYDGPETLTIIK